MKTLNIALVAHDARKIEFVEWVKKNYLMLSKHQLYATGTTGRLISNITLWPKSSSMAIQPFANKVNILLSGPLGGDQQIGAMIAEQRINMLIFFCDNLVTQGHQTDVSALTRLASLYNIAFATNKTTADLLLSSPLIDDADYGIELPACVLQTSKYNNRI